MPETRTIVKTRTTTRTPSRGRTCIRIRETDSILPTLRVLPHGVNRKRLEQAIKELRLPVIIARDSSEADVVMTLKAEYRQKTAGLREAEDRGLPIYVLKSNTIVQMGRA